MPRKTISSPSDKRVGQRRLDLEKVLRKAAQIPDVIQEPVFREFVGLETAEGGCAAALPPTFTACSFCTVGPSSLHSGFSSWPSRRLRSVVHAYYDFSKHG